jgi:cobalamin biosynthesis protein CobD/CbiB
VLQPLRQPLLPQPLLLPALPVGASGTLVRMMAIVVMAAVAVAIVSVAAATTVAATGTVVAMVATATTPARRALLQHHSGPGSASTPTHRQSLPSATFCPMTLTF